MTWRLTFTNGRWQRRFVPELPHALPAYAFAEQRAQCEACAHLIRRTSTADDRELLCAVSDGNRGTGRGCSFMRAESQPCGPTARRFTPITRSPE